MNFLKRTIRPDQIRELSLLLLIVLAILFFGTQIENYYSPRLFNRLSTSVAILAVVAVGQTIVVIMRQIDLSVGSIVGFTAYFVGTQLASNNEMAALMAVLLAVGVGDLVIVGGAVLLALLTVPLWPAWAYATFDRFPWVSKAGLGNHPP